ncbi:MAG: single-stranded DNA-binding protein [Polyangiaceae bacterium]
MSTGMNKVMLLGNLGADPELRFTQKGQPVLHMRLATSESWIDKNTKEVQERTEWHNVTVWGNRGEALSRFLTKGDCIIVDGHLETRSYDKEGQKHYSTDVVAREVFLTGRRTAVAPADEVPTLGEGAAPAPGLVSTNGKKKNGKKGEAELASDIPF